MSAYTDADVQAAAVALWGEGEPAFAYLQKNYPKTAANTTDAVSRILDAVAPAIAARALREAAQARGERGYFGDALTRTWLRARADEIEAAS